MSYLIEEFLNKVNSLDEDLIVEGIDDVKRKYPNIDDDTFMNIIKLDPTYKDGVDSVGTYGKWLLSLYNKTKKMPDNSITNILDTFDKNKRYLQVSDRDIGKYKNIDELEQKVNSIEPHEVSKTRKNKDIRKAVRKTNLVDDAEYVGKFDDFEVYIPKTYGASCKLGQGTTWCTATNSSSRYYNYYSEEGPLYILINTKDKNEKYQIHVESNQFKDSKDKEVMDNELAKLFKEQPNLWQFIKKITNSNDYLKNKFKEIEEKADILFNLNKLLGQTVNFNVEMPNTKNNNFINDILEYYNDGEDDDLLKLLCAVYVSSDDGYLEKLDDMYYEYTVDVAYDSMQENSDFITNEILEDKNLKNKIETEYNVSLETEDDVFDVIISNDDLYQSIIACISNEIESSYNKQYYNAFIRFLHHILIDTYGLNFIKDVQSSYIVVEGEVKNIINDLYQTIYGDRVYKEYDEDIENILNNFNFDTAEDIVSAILPIFIIDACYSYNNKFDDYTYYIYPEYDLSTLGNYL